MQGFASLSCRVHQARQDLQEHLYDEALYAYFLQVWVCFQEVHCVLFAPVRASVVEWLSLIETGAAGVDSQLRVRGNLGCSSQLET